jgi:hypothetical protein
VLLRLCCSLLGWRDANAAARPAIRHDVVGFGIGARENLGICRVGRGRHATMRRQIGPTDGWVGGSAAARIRYVLRCPASKTREPGSETTVIKPNINKVHVAIVQVELLFSPATVLGLIHIFLLWSVRVHAP